MSQTLKSAVIGTGVISEEHLRFLEGSADATLVGVCDLSPAAASYAAERFHAASPYTDYRDMLDKAKPDVVHILTPPKTHKPLATDCLQSGAHVIVEKPAAPTLTEFDELWEIALRSGRRLIEDHNYRFNEPVLEIERRIAAGEIGAVSDIEVRMQLGIRGQGGRYSDANLPHPSHQLPAGVIHEFITHLCYLTLRFMPDFDRVTAAWSNHGKDDLFKYDDLDALVIGDQVHARIRFSCHAGPDCFSIIVRGSDGYLETDLFQPYLRVVKPRPGGSNLSPLLNHLAGGMELVGASIGNLRRKVLQQTPYEGLKLFLTETYAALRDEETPPVTYSDMQKASRLVDALLAEGNRI